MTDLMTRPILDDPRSNDDDICHVTCCKNTDVALCATDVTTMPWDHEAPTSCIVCADLEQQPVILCPATGKPCHDAFKGGQCGTG